jgi:hypothetical protein
MQEKEIRKTKRKRRMKRKQRRTEWRKSKGRRRTRRREKDGQERRLRERPVVTVLLQSKSALLMKSQTDDEHLMTKVLGFCKLGRLKATGAETRSEGSKRRVDWMTAPDGRGAEGGRDNSGVATLDSGPAGQTPKFE